MLKPKKNTSNAITQAKASETKLSQTVIHLEYLFEHGVDFKGRNITLTGDITEGQFDLVDAALSEMERDSKAGVTIKINSGGGSVYEALAIVGRLRSSKCHITTVGFGHMMSAATLILACGEVRQMSKYSFFMHHCSTYEAEGRHTEIKAIVEQMEREELMWAKWMGDFTGKEESFWYEKGKHIDYYLDAQDCLEHGVIDEII